MLSIQSYTPPDLANAAYSVVEVTGCLDGADDFIVGNADYEVGDTNSFDNLDDIDDLDDDYYESSGMNHACHDDDSAQVSYLMSVAEDKIGNADINDIDVNSCTECGKGTYEMINTNEYACNYCDNVLEVNSDITDVATMDIMQNCTIQSNGSTPIVLSRRVGTGGKVNNTIINTSKNAPDDANDPHGASAVVKKNYTEALNNSEERPPPPDVCKLGLELVNEYLQSSGVRRGTILKATFAACLFKLTEIANLGYKQTTMMKMFKVESQDYSKAEKFVNAAIDAGIGRDVIENLKRMRPAVPASIELHIPYNDLPMVEVFITNCLEGLGIPKIGGANKTSQRNKKYWEFCVKLVVFSVRYNVATHSTRDSKCAGAVHVLLCLCPELQINKANLHPVSKITKSTFSRFSKEVKNTLLGREPAEKKLRSRLRKLFKNCGITPYSRSDE